MVNPGAFQGSRKEFLLSQKAAYSAGVVGGYAADALAVIQRLYFRRYPIDLPHDQEPDPETLASIDNDVPDVEQAEPDETQLEVEEYAAAMSALEVRRKAVAFRKAQIKRWLAYQHMKDHDMDAKESGAHNPYRILLHKLTGSTIHCPRRRTAVNVWRKTQRPIIEEEVKVRATKLGTKLAGMAALRDRVAKELYAGLSAEEKHQWEEQAKEEHKAAVKAWKAETEGKLSTDPADRQKCIYGLVNFVQPILDLICEATGWNATLMTGGPEPAHGGRLNVISIHSGSTTGDVKMNFGRAERQRYKKVIVPIYGQYLQKCYSLEECRACALPPSDGFEGMETVDLDADGVNFDSIKIDIPAASISSATTIAASPSTATTAATTNVEPVPRLSRTPTRSRSPRASSPASSRSRSLSRGPSPGLSPRSLPRSLSRGRSPALSPRRSPCLDPPTPASINSILDKVVPASPSTQPSRVVGVTAPPIIPILTNTPDVRGQKRLADVVTDDPPLPKRNRTTCSASNSLPSRNSPSTRIEDGDVAGDASVAECNGVPGAAQTTASETSPPQWRSEALPSTRVTHSAHADTSTPTLAAPSVAESPPATSLHKLDAADNAPAWFSNALAMLQRDDPNLGVSWRQLIGLWAAFEMQENYGRDVAGRLKAKYRPTVVKDWIQRARSATWRPAISSAIAIERDFTNWWTSLQPEWRVEDGGQLDMTRINGDWELLRQPGVNGLLSAVAGLFFWGSAAHGDLVAEMAWSRCIDDCIVAFNGLLATS